MSITTVKQTDIHIGVEKTFSVIHVSDTHLTLADERDDDRKIALATKRSRVFNPPPEDILRETEDYSKLKGFTIIHTGDLIDFVSEANLERAEKFVNQNSVLFIAGNHEYSLYVGEAFEDEAYRNISLAHVQSFFKNPIRFNSYMIGGVNFIGIDNGYYLFDQSQLDMLKQEVAKGFPIVLFMHNPLFEKSLYDYSFELHQHKSAYLTGTPDELLKMGEPSRMIQQKADKPTLKMIEYIKTQSQIKAILTGHLHKDFESNITDTLPQYITGITTIRQINIF